MQAQTNDRLSRWTLRLDGIFLGIAGSAALLTETMGHFFGVGPMAETLGSPHTIGGFEVSDADRAPLRASVVLLRAPSGESRS